VKVYFGDVLKSEMRETRSEKQMVFLQYC